MTPVVQQAGEPTAALAEVREWHIDQAMWHRHAAECGTAADKSEPTRSMLLAAAALHERFADALASRPQQPQAETGSVLDRLNAWRKHPGDGGGNLFRDAAEEIEALQAKIEEIQDVQLGPSDNALLDLIDDLRAGYSDENTSIGPTEQDKAAADMLEQCRAFRLFVYHQVKDGSGSLANRLRDAALAHPNTTPQPQAETPLTEPGPSAPEPSDDVLEALDLLPGQFRTEGGAINRGKLRAAIRYPADYVHEHHWLRQPSVSEQINKSLSAGLRQRLFAAAPVPAAHPNTGAHPPEAEPAKFLRIGLRLVEQITNERLNSTDRYTAEKELNRVLHRLAEAWDAKLNASPPEARADADEPTAREKQMARCLGFFASVIKSGEPWTEHCQREYDEALGRAPLPPEAQEPKT